MIDYFYQYYVLRQMGPGYVVTNVFYALAVVLLLRQQEKLLGRGLGRTFLDVVGLWLLGIVICGTGYRIFGQSVMIDRGCAAVQLLVYALFASKLRNITKMTRSFVFFSCFLHIIPISEPLGKLFEEIDASYVWAEHFTWVVVILLCSVVLAFLKRYSTEKLTFVPRFPCVLLGAIAAIGVIWQLSSSYFQPERGYNVTVAVCFLTITLLGYFMFYTVSREYDRNLELLALSHKQTLDEELLQFSRENYEEIHQLRHELQNHMNYIKLMAEAGEYQKLKEYAATVCGEAEEIFRFVECGNQVINAVMNHAIRQANSMGIRLDYQIVAPPDIPFRETEFCSLLSNLLENALEAAAASGEEGPTVVVRIWPQQDYLFIHVDNPVDSAIPAQRRLSLTTTKKDRRTHGYGTRIIRDLVKKYRGSVKFDMRQGRFLADVMLCLEQEESHEENQSGHL